LCSLGAPVWKTSGTGTTQKKKRVRHHAREKETARKKKRRKTKKRAQHLKKVMRGREEYLMAEEIKKEKGIPVINNKKRRKREGREGGYITSKRYLHIDRHGAHKLNGQGGEKKRSISHRARGKKKSFHKDLDARGKRGEPRCRTRVGWFKEKKKRGVALKKTRKKNAEGKKRRIGKRR